MGERLAHRSRSYENTPPSCGSVWGCDHELRIIGHSRALKSACPGPIENKFAVGVEFKIAGCSGDELFLGAPQCEVLGDPSHSFADAAVTFHGREKLVPKERGVAADKPIPGRRLDVRKVSDDTRS